MLTRGRYADAVSDPAHLVPPSRIWPPLVLTVAALAIGLGWVGFIASDDALYYAGAAHWLEAGPFPGDTHWATRFPLVLSFAGLLAVFGRGYGAFAATALIFYAGLLVATGLFARGVAGARAGWIAAVLAASLPVVVTQATTVGVDLLESSLLLCGAMLLNASGERIGRGITAGLLFGLAMLCRETTALPLVGLGGLFLVGRPVPRRVLLAVGLGAAVVLGAEALFQGAMTGDPFRRYAIAFHHDEHIDRAANLEGNLLVNPAIDPLLVLLVNDDFGPLFWLAAVAVGLGAHQRLSSSGRARLAVLAAMAAASFVLVAVLTAKLVLNPRYFMLPALAAVVLVAAWLDRARAWIRAAVLIGYVGANLALLSVTNTHPRWSMEALVAAARAHPDEVVHGDPIDVRRAALPLRIEGGGRVSATPARAGDLFVAPADRVCSGHVVERYPSPPTRFGGLLDAIGASGLVPDAIRRRMFAPSASMVLVRAG